MAKKILSKKQINNIIQGVNKIAKKDKMPISNVFIFGSYATNKANKNSDLDLCFVSPKFKNAIEAEAYLRTEIYFLDPKIGVPIDVVAYNKKDFKGDIQLVHEIKKTGIEIPLKNESYKNNF